ncbi:MAG: 4-hydroxythreonine-4-phosphate dehydrogenase PdxA [Gemmatimonadetes bacterium]|nr:4-hydroxythreonine-4-phosphate dehydrogenase PdxA [Gemmatimonadota bacterium]
MTLGDPRGIGPEIVAAVLRDPPVAADYVVIGPADLIWDLPGEQVAVGGTGDERRETSGTRPSSRVFPITMVPQVAGKLAGLAVEDAVRRALSGDVDAIVTAPAEKKALHLAGYQYPGHTEWLAALAGNVPVAMMLASDRLRVVLVTTHLALKDVPASLTQGKIVSVGRVTRDALRAWWGIESPRLALCALNPHAGEGGMFGKEDETILAPAARLLDAAGPLPADTVFVRAIKGEFDAVLAPYHDVGMTAIKVASFGHAVNITLGLPFIRTSPDHGTAFDIAGKGIADASSMREAVKMAVQLAGRKQADERMSG